MDLIWKSMLKFNKYKVMNERIIDRKFFVDLVKEVGLNVLYIEVMGEMCYCEIIVSGNMLKCLVEI